MTRALDRGGAVHLLRRLAFGAPAADVEALVGRDPGEAVEELVAQARTAPVDERVRLLLPTGEVEHLQAWWVERMLGPAPERLRERVCLTWHGHFATSWDKVRDVHLMHGQNHLLRTLGLGDFRALLHAVMVDPAMLVWLDGVENRKGQPNENLARELMELFALGVGHYAERDVQEAARGLSGWRVVQRHARFLERQHDDGEKTVLGRTGRFDTGGVVDAVLAHEACPRWVAARLWSDFAGARPSAAELDATARELVACGWDVGRALTWLATRDAFLDAAERGTRIAGPVEFVVGTVLETGARTAPRDLARAAATMGQSLLRPPSVKGWDGGRSWIDSTRWIARQRFAAAAARAVEVPSTAGLVDALLPGRPAPSWRAEVEAAARRTDEPARTLLTAVLASAEYQLR